MDKQHQLEQLFNAANNEQTVYSFGDTKKQFLSTVVVSTATSKVKKTSFLSTKNWIIMFALISTLTASFILFFGANPTNIKSASTEKTISEVKQEHPQKETSEKMNNDQTDHSSQLLSNQVPTFLPPFEDIFQDPVEQKPFDPRSMEKIVSKPLLYEENYVFPKLTEEEIRSNKKKKKEMLKALEKFDKKVYAYIPIGSFEYEGKTISIQAFYMQKTEVSNLEYRTFLFDLLIQNRKEEFLKAKPDQSMWTKLFGKENQPMEELYFSHASYNEYPVVNVSREGVELYCKWLSQELVKFIGDSKEELYNDVRIPLHVEWVKAASTEGTQLPYPWDGIYLRDSKGVYLANFKPTDSTYFDDGGFFTVKVNSYTTNALGLYNMSGNVAEMIYDTYKLKDAPGTAGGGWMNNAEEIKILGPDPYEGMIDAHPNIGFRVVMTMLKNP